MINRLLLIHSNNTYVFISCLYKLTYLGKLTIQRMNDDDQSHRSKIRSSVPHNSSPIYYILNIYQKRKNYWVLILKLSCAMEINCIKILSSYYEQSIKYMISILQHVRVIGTFVFCFLNRSSKNFNWVLNYGGSSYYKWTTNFWSLVKIMSHVYVFWKNFYSQTRYCSLESWPLQLACIWEIKKCASISTLSKWKGEKLLSNSLYIYIYISWSYISIYGEAWVRTYKIRFQCLNRGMKQGICI